MENINKDLFNVVTDYTYALDTLDSYDYQRLTINDTTNEAPFQATYDNAMQAILSLKERFGESALFVPDDDPLRFYRAIGAFAAGHLAPQGLLALEINEALAAETCALLQSQGFSTEVREDFRGKPRMVTATLSGQ